MGRHEAKKLSPKENGLVRSQREGIESILSRNEIKVCALEYTDIQAYSMKMIQLRIVSEILSLLNAAL